MSIQNITHNYSINDLGNINVTVQFECIEDIAQYKQLNKPESYTEDTNGKNDNV